jgi:hypothetical protein
MTEGPGDAIGHEGIDGRDHGVGMVAEFTRPSFHVARGVTMPREHESDAPPTRFPTLPELRPSRLSHARYISSGRTQSFPIVPRKPDYRAIIPGVGHFRGRW